MKAGLRRPFIELRLAELSVPPAGPVRLFLERFDAPALWRELAGAGLLDGLAERGYRDVLLRTDVVDGEHRLRITPRGGRVSLVELRLAEAGCVVDEPLLSRFGLEILSFLSIHWLALQNPRTRFTRERRRLPGQKYPGLRLGRRVYALLLRWAAAWGKDALVNFPEYFHNALFYGVERAGRAVSNVRPAEASLPPFRFLSPVRQGRFEALRRDLAHLPIATASAELLAGRVREAASGTPARWEAAEMVVALSEGLRGYLDSPDYRQAADAERDSVRFEARR